MKPSRTLILGAALLSLLHAGAQNISMDEADLRMFKARGTPFDAPAVRMESAAPRSLPAPYPRLSLDGDWEMAEGGADARRLASPVWEDAIPARVPGSVHSALWKAGRIPDPYFGRNDSIAEQQSYKTWWLRRVFTADSNLNAPVLFFGGVANRCSVWLNGKLLGSHEGMFGGPRYDLGKALCKGDNTLVVRLDPIPQEFEPEGTFFGGANTSWKNTVVCNCVYGWHYSRIPSLGIWRSVVVEDHAAVAVEDPFIAAKSLDGDMRMSVTLRGYPAAPKGVLRLSVTPDNFEGGEQCFEYRVDGRSRALSLNLSFRVDDPQLWWPNDMGAQNLYKAHVAFIPDKGAPDAAIATFGIRTIEMAPFPEGPTPELYNWTFVVNGRKMFVKGTGWCTMNPLLDFPRERYDHFLTLARLQHVQLMRAWGGGIPESEDFYDLCDRYGIMVMQEWPTAWDSHNTQPYHMLEETVRLNTIRLRNHPSLVMWGGGNESSNPVGPAIEMMGRYSIELDGTRPFHRGEAFGGSRHNYDCWWENAHLNHNLTMTSRFWGEFGIASLPDPESVRRYLTPEQAAQWPPVRGGSFLHHMPIFGQVGEYGKLAQYSGYFTPGKTMDDFILGSQLGQVVGVRHTLERARTMWPETTGALYYKMNDNYPAASWSCADFYGAVKPLHYFVRNSFAPVAAVMLFDCTNLSSREVSLPLWLLDDAGALEGKQVEVTFTCYNDRFKQVAAADFRVDGDGQPVRRLGSMELSREQTRAMVLLFVAQVRCEGVELFRTFYFTNTEVRPGSLFNLPRTTLSVQRDGRKVTVTNTGANPAVGVSVGAPGRQSELIVTDNYFWLGPAESRTVEINGDFEVAADCWNKESNPYQEQ